MAWDGSSHWGGQAWGSERLIGVQDHRADSAACQASLLVCLCLEANHVEFALALRAVSTQAVLLSER